MADAAGKDPRKNDQDPDAADADDLQKAMKYKSCFCIDASHPPRKFAIWLAQKKWFGNIVLVLIIVNCMILATQSPTIGPAVKCEIAPSVGEFDKYKHNCGQSDDARTCGACQRLGYCSCNGPLDAVKHGSFDTLEFAEGVEIIFTIAFTCEAVVKVIASGFAFHPGAYLRNGWNWIDFVVVLMSWVSMLPGVENFSAIRTVRVLRPLRTMSRIPGMGVIVGAMLKSVRPLSNVMLLCAVVFFVFGILGIQFWYNMPKTYCGPDTLYYSSLSGWRPMDESVPSSPTEFTNFRCHSLNTLLPVEDPETGAQASCRYDQFGEDPIPDGTTAEQCIGVKGVSKEIHFFQGVNFEDMVANYNTLVFNASVYQPPEAAGIDTPEIARTDLEDRDKARDQLYNYNLQGTGCGCGQVCTSALYFYCDSMGAISFDEIGSTMIAIFQSVTLEGWTDLMYRTDELKGVGASENAIVGYGWVYFILLIFFAGLFVVNLALAVIAESYADATDEEDTRNAELEEERVKEDERENEEKLLVGAQSAQPKGVCKKRLVRWMRRDKGCKDKIVIAKLKEMVEGNKFMGFVMLFIGVNTALLACDYHNDALCTSMEMKVDEIYDPVPTGLKKGELNGPCMSTDLTELLELGNVILTIFFAFEMVIKWIALGLMEYYADGFNQFDSFIVATSLFELAVANLGGTPEAHSSGGFITVLRAGRLFRVFKLARAWTALKKVLNTVASSMGSLLPLSIILFLFMFIYSLLGMQLYGGMFFFPGRGECASWERHNNGCSVPRANFDQFITAMVAIFQMMTGEDWNVVMYDGIAASSSGSFFYFMVLVVFGNYIILNLFLAILLSGFEGKDEEDESDDEGAEGDSGKSEGGLMKKLCACCASSKVTPDDEGGDDKGLEKLHGAEGIKAIAESDRDENTIPDHKAFGLFGKNSCVRKVAFGIVHNSLFENFILTLIIISSMTLGYQNPVKHDGPNKDGVQAVVMFYMDVIFLAIFTVEFALKHVAFGVVFHPRAYWRDAWNIMDGFIVIVGYIGILAEDLPQLKPLRAIRTMRALRPLRALRRFPGMKLAVNCLLGSIPLMIPMALVSLLFFLIFAILGLQVFSGKFWSCSFDAHGEDDESAKNAAKFLAMLVGYRGLIPDYPGRVDPVAECYPPVGAAATLECEWTDMKFTRDSCPTGCDHVPNAVSEAWLIDHVNSLGYYQRDAAGEEFADPLEPLRDLSHVMTEFPYMQVPQLKNQAFKLLLGKECSCDNDTPRKMTQASATADTVVACPAGCTETDLVEDTHLVAKPNVMLYATGRSDPYGWDNDYAVAGTGPVAPGFDDFCTHPHSLHGAQCSRAECRLVGGMWTNAMTHFDNIWQSLLCLFEMSTTEGWPAVMWSGVDANNVGQQPYQSTAWTGGTISSMLYFVGFLVVGNFFVLNLFVGAVIDNYLDLEEDAKKDMEVMTADQKEWVETQKKMVSLQLRAKIPEPENAFRKKVYQIVQKTAFEVVVTVLIIVNILILAMKHRAMSSGFSEGFLVASNWIFTVAFIIEALMKITAYGPKHYWKDAWNKFDFLLVLVSVLDKILVLDGIGTFFRVFRVARIVRVARSASDLRRMFQTIIISIPALANVGSLLFLLFFIYSILGVNFFHSACAVPPYFATLDGSVQGGSATSVEAASAMFDPCSDSDYGHGFEGFVSVNVAQNRDIFFALAADADRDGTISAAEWLDLTTAIGSYGTSTGNAPVSVVEASSQVDITDKVSIKKLFGSATDGYKLLEKLQEFAQKKQYPQVEADVASSALLDDVEVVDYVDRPAYVASDWTWVTAGYGTGNDADWLTKERPPIKCAELTLQCGGFEDPDQMLLQEFSAAPTCYGIATCVVGAAESINSVGLPSETECAAGSYRPTCAITDDGCPAGCDSTAGFPEYAECVCENLDYNANFKTFGVAFLTLIRMATGEYWNGLQHDLTDVAGDTYAFAYFFSFLILATFIMLNLVVAVMIINYNEQQADSDRAVNQDHMDHFRDVWESFDEEGRGWMRTEKLPALLEKLDIPLGFHSSKPMAKVAQKKALQELAMQLPDHDGWIHYTETLFALAYRNQSEQAVEDLPDDIPRVDEIQAQKDLRVQEDGQLGVMDPKPLQETMAVLSFQAVYRSYQERRNKGGEGSVDPLKRKLRPGQAALAAGGDGAAGAAPDQARPEADYRRANP